VKSQVFRARRFEAGRHALYSIPGGDPAGDIYVAGVRGPASIFVDGNAVRPHERADGFAVLRKGRRLCRLEWAVLEQ